jgi:hypothetical protein
MEPRVKLPCPKRQEMARKRRETMRRAAAVRAAKRANRLSRSFDVRMLAASVE